MYSKVTARPNNKTYLIITLFIAFSMLLAACAAPVQSNNPPAASTPAVAQTSGPLTLAQTQPAAGEAEIKVATDPTLGDILVDSKGMTLYMFTKDTADVSNCNADCLAKWPPLLTQGSPKLDSGVNSALVSSTSLTDGRKIVTYNHMPLYYFYKDTKPGDVLGQGVGSVWYVVSPAGEAIKTAGATSPTTAPAATTAPTAPAAGSAEPTINIASDAKLGQFLVDDKGMTLYMFTVDDPDKSNCDASCLAKWPPLLTQGSPVLGQGLDQSLLGSTTMADGRMIVTYNHMPLYYFYKDTKPGDVFGQGVGSVWYVVAPDGSVIKK